MLSKNTIFWGTVGVIVIAAFAIRAHEDENSEIPIVRSQIDHDRIMRDVQKLTIKPFGQDDERDVTPSEGHDLRLALIKTKGLMAYQPTVYSNYFIAAKCEMLLGDNASAEGDFIRCLKCPNNNPEYDQVVYVDTCAEARYLLSKCYFHDGMYKPAAELALSAVKLHPDSALYRLQVARADVQLKQDKEAKSELTAALKIDPNLSEAKSLMTLLNEPAN